MPQALLQDGNSDLQQLTHPFMSAHPSRPQGAVLNLSSHRSFVALTACVITALGNSASAPYLMVSEPEPMRQAPPRPVAVTMPTEIKPEDVTEDETDAEAAAREAANQPVAPTAVVKPPATPSASTPSSGSDRPKLELLPDAVPPGRTRLEDILPFFVPPSPPASRATYEQK